MRGTLTRLRESMRGRHGIAAVEFAIVAPFMIGLLAMTVDLGLAVERSIRLENAARAGAQFALRFPDDLTGIRSAAEAGAGPDATATVTRLPCQCPTATGANGTVIACNGTCATGVAAYIQVSITRPFTPIFPTSALIPFTSLGATNANVVARVS